MHRTFTPVLGNAQRLDGGSMYGNCPRAVWERWSPPDEHGRIALACRALLIEERPEAGAEIARRVLLETGIGTFFEPKLKARYGVVESEHVLLENLAGLGVEPADIDVIVLSHLHFDHVGGLLTPYAEGQSPSLLFPKAAYVVGAEAYARARAPHPRDRASFIAELPALLEASGRLEVVQGERSPVLGEGYRFHYSEGHTPGLMMTEVATPEGPLVFVSDLIPGAPWMHLPITMGYDRFPERLIDEKRALLEDLLARNGRVFFTHDPVLDLARVARDERGRFHAESVAR